MTSPAPSPTSADSTARPAATPETPPSEGLPEEFVLTPELVEEEAIRGDIMLRGAVVLLAVLFGWTHQTTTPVLTRIRTGELLAAHGWLPPRTDSFFSFTAGDRAWVNLAWLGDLWLAGVYAVGGGALLSVLCAVLSGGAFWLVGRTSVSGVSTWWGSICAGLAVLAVFPLLTPGPTLMTVLGLAATLYLVQRGEETGQRLWWWLLPPVMVVWGNVDERAYLGMAWLGLYAVGRFVLERPAGGTRPWRWPVLLAVVAPLLHPFPLGVLRAPVVQMRHFNALMREYGGEAAAEYPYLWRPVWEGASLAAPGWHLGGALVLAGLAVILLVLNRRRLNVGWAFGLVGLNGLAAASGVDFTAVAVVNAVFVTLNGQQWYRDHCRQEYTLNPRELLFSRGGRAVTVLGLFLLAYFDISGHMTGAEGRRIGFGFSNRLQRLVEGYRELLGKVGVDEFDDHPFHVTPQQGDLLIWLGRRSFTDSRLILFSGIGGGAAETDLLAAQRQLTAALRSPSRPLTTPQAIVDWARVWQEPFQAYGITHVVVPLEDPTGYALWVNLASQGMAVGDGSVVRFWQQVGVTGPAAALYRRAAIGDDAPAGLMDFLAQRSHASIVEETFRVPQAGQPVRRGLFPRGPTYYETWLLLPEPVVPNESLVARHYATRLAAAERSLFETMAYCHQILRHARRGLAENPNSFETYLLLGNAYEILWEAEGSLASHRLALEAAERRFHQAIAAYHHASVCRPREPQPHANLYLLYGRHGDYDLALRHLDQLRELTGRYTLLARDDPQFATQQQQGKRLREQLAESVQKTREAVERAQAGGLEAAVRTALQQRCPALAVELLERDLTLTMQSFELSQQYASLLLLCGRSSEGLQQVERQLMTLERTPAARAALQALRPVDAYANLAADEYERAMTLWEEFGRDRLATAVESALASLPLVTAAAPHGDGWPLFQYVTARETFGQWEPDWELACWQRAMCELEEGRNRQAKELLEGVLASNPRSLLRPPIAAYLTMLTGESVSPAVEGDAAAPPGRRTDRPPSPALPIRALPPSERGP